MEGRVKIVSRRMVRPAAEHAGELPEHETVYHLTPLDLRMITVDYVQKGVVFPKPPGGGEHVVEHLASSFARALARFYPLAGRLAVAETASPDCVPAISISLHCDGEGAEFVHAVAPGVTVADIADSLYVPRVVWSFFPLNGMLGTDAAVESHPVLAAQVTELADGLFVAMSLNHGVADGFTFWHLFHTWSEINRRSVDNADLELSTPPPVFNRWFVDGIPVPIPLPFAKLEDMVRRPVYTPVEECFLHFSAESVRTLKEKANAEMAGTATATATISSLQSVLAHTWRAVCRARRLAPERETAYGLSVGLRARVKEVPQEYMGNTVTGAAAKTNVGELLDKGLGWAALLLNRAVASADEASVRRMLAAWPEKPSFVMVANLQIAGVMAISGSPRFDVFGNDFGWGRPVGVRSGAGNKFDGKVTVYEGRGGGGGSMAVEICLPPETLARLVADEEFMSAVTAPLPTHQSRQW
uniref:Acetyltransferase n=1 Tax=Oryza punctata TaxID=4537 RepID=A0A0E0LQJ2_ORYPU